jgi:hypothetical protein
MDVFDWSDIDFSRFTFNANDTPQEILFNAKVKNYKRLQILSGTTPPTRGLGFSILQSTLCTGTSREINGTGN